MTAVGLRENTIPAFLTLVKSDSKNFDERNIDEMLVKALIFVMYCSTFIHIANYLETLILFSGFTLND